MADLVVDVSKLAGFKLDLNDISANFTANASRLLPRVALAGASGRMAELTSAAQKLQSTLYSAHQRDVGVLDTMATNLGTAATQFSDSDEQHAAGLTQVTTTIDGQAAAPASTTTGVTRYGGLQLPTLQDVQDVQCTVRQAVTASIDILTPYDDPLGRAIGIKPAADYLTPLVADWEHLQEIGKRITALGLNDFVTAQNINGGKNWLQTSWTGEAATAFATTATGLATAINQRSDDLDTVGKIVENGGLLLERLVYNQATGLLAAITQSMSFLNFTLPLGVWALLGDSDMQGEMRSRVFDAVDTLKRDATTRNDAITSAIGRIAGVLNYEPGQAVPGYNPSEFELPTKIVADQGVKRYGYGGNVWWEDTPAPDSRV
ncbi:hypothetical protein [Nocardia blacklockiae]|uniref:hypothetical protein n=1 Tax=Nocardia blacklockiae TaxID=480036 RepID=UPI001895C4FD|nr:hypothetical protein [Nocardia blacklockiae]MBF6175297.1 hypothetical protein [Nocardia blacklockiae]